MQDKYIYQEFWIGKNNLNIYFLKESLNFNI